MLGGLVVRADSNAAGLATAVTRIVRRVAPTVPVEDVLTVSQIKDQSVAPRRLNAALVSSFGILAVIIAAVGEGWCFALDAVSYLAVIASLLLMRLRPEARRAPRKETKVLHELREGWRYVAGSAPIRSILLLLALVSLVGMPYTVLMPVFASTVLHGGPHTLGFMMAAVGVGALSGAIFLANRRTVLGLGKIIPMMSALFGAGLIGF